MFPAISLYGLLGNYLTNKDDLNEWSYNALFAKVEK